MTPKRSVPVANKRSGATRVSLAKKRTDAAIETVEVELAFFSDHAKVQRFDTVSAKPNDAPVRAMYIHKDTLAALGNPSSIRLSIARGESKV